MQFHFQVFGIWISNAFGNCFKPAFQFRDRELIIRTNNWLETKIYHRTDGSWDWNSEHIARHLGKHFKGNEEQGYPDSWEYQGWLGCHYYI
ncbi:hypothetical protein [Nostoc sp. 106C]|uniref:hypothetical protein n=1 Tax=Nostoc sp. 106C TaxID=1932667 RepID=UPI000A375C08|nr:hypothetical protein [Nostoc sp. 106C]OUL28583.1 hypothetical protein BV375_17980 [Nostoc sp. 106C]